MICLQFEKWSPPSAKMLECIQFEFCWLEWIFSSWICTNCIWVSALLKLQYLSWYVPFLRKCIKKNLEHMGKRYKIEPLRWEEEGGGWLLFFFVLKHQFPFQTFVEMRFFVWFCKDKKSNIWLHADTWLTMLNTPYYLSY